MLLDRLKSEGSKKILSLDGGGMRGALTLGFLYKLENLIRSKTGDDNAKLCDYFDLIGGTSTGAIIAASLAIGMDVDSIRQKYFSLGKYIFGKKNRWWIPWESYKFIRAKYTESPLEDELKKYFGNIKLGDCRIKTGLCIVAKRADTNSLWPLINHPEGKFYYHNKDLYLTTLIRASTSAPTFFIPIPVEVNYETRETAAFVDGGVSMANNPALELLKVATLEGFPFKWKTGEKNLLIVSIGTGMMNFKKFPNKITRSIFVEWGMQLPEMFMQDASWQNQLLLQWMSKSPTNWYIDSEIENLGNDILGDIPLLTYMRYNVMLERNANGKDLNTYGYDMLTDKEIKELRRMDSYTKIELLYEIGKVAGQDQIKPDHFNNFL